MLVHLLSSSVLAYWLTLMDCIIHDGNKIISLIFWLLIGWIKEVLHRGQGGTLDVKLVPPLLYSCYALLACSSPLLHPCLARA